MPGASVDRKLERDDGTRIDDLSGCLHRRSTLSHRGDRAEPNGRSAGGEKRAPAHPAATEARGALRKRLCCHTCHLYFVSGRCTTALAGPQDDARITLPRAVRCLVKVLQCAMVPLQTE